MTQRKRTIPVSEAKALLDLLVSYGIPIAQCAVDITADGVKVSPPANSNVGDSLAKYLDGPPRGPKKAGQR